MNEENKSNKTQIQVSPCVLISENQDNTCLYSGKRSFPFHAEWNHAWFNPAQPADSVSVKHSAYCAQTILQQPIDPWTYVKKTKVHDGSKLSKSGQYALVTHFDTLRNLYGESD